MTPIERMVDAVVKCVRCGAQGIGTCDCGLSEQLADKIFRRVMEECTNIRTLQGMTAKVNQILRDADREWFDKRFGRR